MTLKAEHLRMLLDQAAGQGNIQPVRDYIEANPELDLNDITPNNLSVLWWALSPPKGKSVNPALIAYLSSLAGVNIVQTYQDYTPRQYIALLHQRNDLFNEILTNLEVRENQYVVPQDVVPRAGQNNPHNANLADIANDSQNVHRSEVVHDTDQSVIRLYLRYGAKLNTVATLKMIREYNMFSFVEGNSNLKSALDVVERDVTTRIYKLQGREDISLTISDILSLIWHAANEQDEELLCGAKKTGSDQKERINAIFKALIDGSGYCWVGRSTRIVHSLNARHIDVRHSMKQLDNEQSRNKYYAIIGQELSVLAQKEISQYWKLIKEAFLKDDEFSDEKKDDNSSEQDVRKNHIDFIKKLLNECQLIATLKGEMLNDETISHIKEELKNNLLPIQCYRPIKALSNIQNLYIFLGQQKLFDDALTYVSELSPQEFLDHLIQRIPMPQMENIIRMGLTGFLKNYVAHLEEAQKNVFFHEFVKNCAYSLESMIDLKEVLARTVMSHSLACKYRGEIEILAWFQALPPELQQEFIQYTDNVILANQLLTDEKIFQFALQNRCLQRLNFSAIDLRNTDLRGFNLSGVDLTGVSLTNADLQLISYDNQTLLGLKNANFLETHFSFNFLYVLIKKIQDDIARQGEGNVSEIEVAKKMLRRFDINLNIKDNDGVTLLERILGKNRFISRVNRLHMPPIIALLDCPCVIECSSAVDSAVRPANLKNYYMAAVAVNAVVGVVGMVGIVGTLIVGAAAAATGLKLVGLAIAGAAVIVAVVVVVGGTAELVKAAVEVGKSGYRYLSTHRNPYVLTKRNLERVKTIGSGIAHAIVSPFRWLGQVITSLSGPSTAVARGAISESVDSLRSPLLLGGANTAVIFRELNCEPTTPDSEVRSMTAQQRTGQNTTPQNVVLTIDPPYNSKEEDQTACTLHP